METERAEPLQRTFTDARGSGGEVPRRRFPRGAARRVRALRRDRRADPARGAEILERRAAGSLCVAGGGAAAPCSRRASSRLNRGASAAAPESREGVRSRRSSSVTGRRARAARRARERHIVLQPRADPSRSSAAKAVCVGVAQERRAPPRRCSDGDRAKPRRTRRLDPGRVQGREEFLRVADAGKREHARAAQATRARRRRAQAVP